MNVFQTIWAVALSVVAGLTAVAIEYPVAYQVIYKSLLRFAGWGMTFGLGYIVGHGLLFWGLRDCIDPRMVDEAKKVSDALCPPLWGIVAFFVGIGYLSFLLALPSLLDAHRRKPGLKSQIGIG